MVSPLFAHVKSLLAGHGRVPRFLIPASLILLFLTAGCSLIPERERVLFLGWDEDGRSQLFSVREEDDPLQHSNFASDVLDFAPAPGGDRVILAVSGPDGGTELWLQPLDAGTQARLVRDCGSNSCEAFVWSRDGRKLLFEERLADGAGVASYVRWLDVDSGDVQSLLTDAGTAAAAASLSADEEWAAYFSPADEGNVLFNLANGERRFITNEIGTAATWAPSGSELLLPRFELLVLHGDEGDDHLDHSHDYRTATHLLYMNLASGESRSLSGDVNAEDGAPAWSPDGEWIAFTRRIPRTDSPREIWIMRKDGSEGMAVAADPQASFGPPQWTGDGAGLVFQRYLPAQPAKRPSIWQLDLASGAMLELAAEGMLPRVISG